MSSGIYKITNLVNNKIYIGCSKNIEHRWNAHKSEAFLSHNPAFNFTIHRAFRKYGLENFSFEIIELIDKNQSEKLFEQEKYWIKKYDSFNKGYNETEGGDSGPSKPNEKNPNAKLTNKDVKIIRTLLLENKLPSEVYELFKDKISRRGFDHIWRGENWIDIMPEAIEYSKTVEYKSYIKSQAALLKRGKK